MVSEWWALALSSAAAGHRPGQGRGVDVTEYRPEGQRDHGEAEPPLEGPPTEVVQQAKRAFMASAEELLPLVFDSLVDADDEPESHRLRFERPDLAVNLDVEARVEGTEISGVVIPEAARMSLYIRGADLALVSDVEGGRFAFVPVPHGLVRLMIEMGGGQPQVWTEWFRV